MQTKKSHYTKKAKSTTQMEFEDNVRAFWQWAKTALALECQRLGLQGVIPRISWDNNRIQKNADLGRMGVDPAEKVPLAPYMPDGHKVIEHVFAVVKHKLVDAIYSIGNQRLTPIFAQQLVLWCFQQAISAQSVSRDADTLPLTYEVIATPAGQMFMGPDGRLHEGTGGDWAPKRYR
jgi:hypothetical protein